MGDEMLSVFYSGDIFPSHGKISTRGVTSLKASFDEKSEFRLFKDYFGLIRLVQNVADLESAEPGFDSLYDFTYTKRSRVDSMGSDHSLTSSSSGGNPDIDLCIETSKVPAPSLAPGAPTRVSKRNVENSSEVANRNRKNRESKKKTGTQTFACFAEITGRARRYIQVMFWKMLKATQHVPFYGPIPVLSARRPAMNLIQSSTVRRTRVLQNSNNKTHQQRRQSAKLELGTLKCHNRTWVSFFFSSCEIYWETQATHLQGIRREG